MIRDDEEDWQFGRPARVVRPIKPPFDMDLGKKIIILFHSFAMIYVDMKHQICQIQGHFRFEGSKIMQ
jgi:hypothetical protein